MQLLSYWLKDNRSSKKIGAPSARSRGCNATRTKKWQLAQAIGVVSDEPTTSKDGMDGDTAKTWKQDIKRLTRAWGMMRSKYKDLQALAYKVIRIKLCNTVWIHGQKMYATWLDFKTVFDKEYISPTLKALNMNEFLTLE